MDEAIYIILSFQTDVPRARSTWKSLRQRFPTWDSLHRATNGAVANALRQGGLHRQKARTIKQLLRQIDLQNGRLSLRHLHRLSDADAEKELLKLPGLSWKGARCVMLYSLDRNAFPVDSNSFRVLQRLGIVRQDAVYRRRSLHDALQNSVEPHRRRALHVNLVIHGQRTCTPGVPYCSVCPLSRICPKIGVPPEAFDVPPGAVSRARSRFYA